MRYSLAFLFAFLFLAPVSAFAQQPDILEVLTISGEIRSGTAEDIAKQVDAINENAKVKAVLLVLDTPGGGVTASSQIYEDLSRLKVPVVAWCQSVCASGGVYVMMAPSVKYIAVRNETITGSVGVIMHMMRYNRLLQWAKIDPETYRSGPLKDAGNPTRAGEPKETEYLQGIVTTLAQRFYAIVAKARPHIKNWDELKTARILIGKEAVDMGLVDAIATRAEVEKKAKELSGSKTIFTRDELKKMSAAADGPHPTYKAPALDVTAALSDLHWAAETAKEIMSGESVKFAYRMPYSF